MRPPPPSPALTFFFFGPFLALDGKFFVQGGKLQLPNSPRWGRKKEGKSSSSFHTVAVFIDRIFNVNFFVSVYVCLCSSAILIKPRQNNSCMIRILSLLFLSWYKQFVAKKKKKRSALRNCAQCEFMSLKYGVIISK